MRKIVNQKYISKTSPNNKTPAGIKIILIPEIRSSNVLSAETTREKTCKITISTRQEKN